MCRQNATTGAIACADDGARGKRLCDFALSFAMRLLFLLSASGRLASDMPHPFARLILFPGQQGPVVLPVVCQAPPSVARALAFFSRLLWSSAHKDALSKMSELRLGAPVMESQIQAMPPAQSTTERTCCGLHFPRVAVGSTTMPTSVVHCGRLRHPHTAVAWQHKLPSGCPLPHPPYLCEPHQHWETPSGGWCYEPQRSRKGDRDMPRVQRTGSDCGGNRPGG